MIKNNYLFKLLKVLFWPIIFIIGQFLVKYIFVSAFNYSIKSDMTNEEFINYMNTFDYSYRLDKFLGNYTLLMMIILFVVFIIFLLKEYKKYKRINNKFNIFIPILFGISVSLMFNIAVFNLNNLVHITNIFNKSSIPIYVQIICTGVLGPILEELLFRGIVYNKLKSFNGSICSVILTSLIFGLLHFDMVNMLYAFFVSFILIYLYDKYDNIMCPIIMHISLNLTTILMINIIIQNYIIFNLYLLVLSIFLFIITYRRSTV